MASNEQLCLEWNDFESNISKSFREIRDNGDLFDVTIACEDEQVQAHKLILSACSPFFKRVLGKNPHQHPLLFLRGVKYREILSILDFMYCGEVNIAQEDLQSFLAVAEDLKVKGLTQNNQPLGRQGQKTKDQDHIELFSTCTKRPLEVSSASPSTKPSVSTDVMVESFEGEMLVDIEDPNNDHTGFGEENNWVIDNTKSEVLQFDENKGLKIEGSLNPEDFVCHERDPGTKKIFKCNICNDYFFNKSQATSHVEAKHLNVTYSCEFCGKEFKSKDTWKQHKRRNHTEQKVI